MKLFSKKDIQSRIELAKGRGFKGISVVENNNEVEFILKGTNVSFKQLKKCLLDEIVRYGTTAILWIYTDTLFAQAESH